MKAFQTDITKRLLCSLAAAVVLTNCGLLNTAGGVAQNAAQSAVGLLTAPVRVLNGALGVEDTAPGHPVSDDEWMRRMDEIRRKGDYPGRRSHPTHDADRLLAAAAQP